jgi:hypothetical protein
MNLNSILIGSTDPQRLKDYYTTLFGTPGWIEGGYSGWQLGTGFVTVGPHDQVTGSNTQPRRHLHRSASRWRLALGGLVAAVADKEVRCRQH